MKIAILVTGQYRPKIKGAKNLIKRMQSVFETDNIFFHTWSDQVSTTPIMFHDRLSYCPEPKLDYHPHSIDWIGKHGKWIKYTSKRLLYNKMQHANKQILAYADLLSKTPDDFDVVIRTRWDIRVSQTVDFKPYLEKAYKKGPVGFMTRPNRGHSHNRLLQVPKDDILDDWYGYLPDQLIMHRKEHFDINLANKLHAEKNLAPAEWGFYQVMSEPFGDIHTSIHGGAVIAR